MKLDVPVDVGVPEITPVVAASVSPAGRLPDEIDHVYAGVPPVACIAAEYAVPSVAHGSDEDEIASGFVVEPALAATVIDIVADAVNAGLLASLTVTVKLNAPLVAGVPPIMPPDEIERPPGNRPPVIDQAYGAVPPVALNAPVYDCPAVAPGNAVDAMANGAGVLRALPFTDIVKVAVADCAGEPESLTVTPNENVPLAVGVPEIAPLDVARVSPAGSWPEVMFHV